MRTLAAMLALAMLVSAGCKKTDEGVETTTPTIDIDIGTRKDTINTPTVTTKPETVIVNRPVVKPPPPE
jgi:hypothetical protein